MNPILLISTIILYILSLIAAFIFAIAWKKLSGIKIKIALILHSIFIISAGVIYLFNQQLLIQKYCTLMAFCSGLSLSGWAIRNPNTLTLVKLYFSMFLISIPFFIYSPSSLFYFISGSMKQFQPEKEFKLKGNYYLVEQQSMLNLSKSPTKYKVIKKYGLYNKSIARDVNFTAEIDSVSLIALTNDTLILKAYSKSFDSVQIGLKPGMKPNTISKINTNKCSRLNLIQTENQL